MAPRTRDSFSPPLDEVADAGIRKVIPLPSSSLADFFKISDMYMKASGVKVDTTLEEAIRRPRKTAPTRSSSTPKSTTKEADLTTQSSRRESKALENESKARPSRASQLGGAPELTGSEEPAVPRYNLRPRRKRPVVEPSVRPAVQAANLKTRKRQPPRLRETSKSTSKTLSETSTSKDVRKRISKRRQS